MLFMLASQLVRHLHFGAQPFYEVEVSSVSFEKDLSKNIYDLQFR